MRDPFELLLRNCVVEDEGSQFFEVFEAEQADKRNCQQCGQDHTFEIICPQIAYCLDAALALSGEQKLLEL